MLYSVSQTKSFEAAHRIKASGADEGYGRIHGHSFVVTVTCTASEPNEHGWVIDFGDLDRVLSDVVAQLDHQTLNDVPGLEQPTFENIMRWIADAMADRGITLSRIEIARPTLGQSAALVL